MRLRLDRGLFEASLYSIGYEAIEAERLRGPAAGMACVAQACGNGIPQSEWLIWHLALNNTG